MKINLLPRFAQHFSVVIVLFALSLMFTWNGVLTASSRLMDIVLLGVFLGAWVVARWKYASTFPKTVLDIPILLWGVAFILSFVVNHEVWRRSLIGIWFCGLYILVWYVLHDLHGRALIRRVHWVNALIIALAFFDLMGLFQTREWWAEIPRILSREIAFSLPRPVSIFGNPNSFGAVLVLLLPVVLSQLERQKGIQRFLLILLFVLTGVLLILTYSRGAWIGAVVSCGVYVVLWLYRQQLYSWSRLKAKIGLPKLALAGGVLLIGVVGGGLFLARSLDEGGRGTDLRAYIYDTALITFAEQPLTGSGIFTFGRALAEFNSSPPLQPHSHAHNLPLQVGAELGIFGILALLATGGAITFWVVRQLRASSIPQRELILICGGFAGLVGYFVHHLFDMPSMMPAIAITALLTACITVMPHEPVWRKPKISKALSVLTMVLTCFVLVTGIYSTVIYVQYYDIVSRSTQGDYLHAAQEIEFITTADPNHPTYIQQQGMMYAIAHAEQSADVLPEAASAFERYLELEPYYAYGWANYAALLSAQGDAEGALMAISRAVELAARDPIMALRAGDYAVTAGLPDRAREFYQQALELSPALVLLAEWTDDPAREGLQADFDETLVRPVQLLIEGDPSQTLQELETFTPSFATYAIEALAQAELGNLPEASRLFALVRDQQSENDQVWAWLIQARLAQLQGDDAEAERALAEASSLLHLGVLGRDWPYGENINYIEFLSLSLPRQFVPQLDYISANPVALALESWLIQR